MYVKSYLCKSAGRFIIFSAIEASIFEYAEAASVNFMKYSRVIDLLTLDQHFLIHLNEFLILAYFGMYLGGIWKSIKKGGHMRENI